MKRLLNFVVGMGVLGVVSIGVAPTSALSASPADGYDIHVQAPHMMADGQLGGLSTIIVKGSQMNSYSVCYSNRQIPKPSS